MALFRRHRTPLRLRQGRYSWFLVTFFCVLLALLFRLNLRHVPAMILHHEGGKLQEHHPHKLSSFPTKDSYVSNKKSHPAHQQRIVFPKSRLQNKHDTIRNITQVPPSGAFVHIGKTAGSSLSVLLRNGCHSFVPKPCRTIPALEESMASKLVESYYHVPDFQHLPTSSHSFYILSVRDPLDRTVSAFLYDHPRNSAEVHAQAGTTPHAADVLLQEAAYRCFPSLETFVAFVGDNVTDYEYYLPPDRISRSLIPSMSHCRNLARAVLQNKVRKFQHLFFNYGKILSLLPIRIAEPNQSTTVLTTAVRNENEIQKHNNPVIYVTRKEHLWEDWDRINAALEGPLDADNSERSNDVIETDRSSGHLGETRHSAAAVRNVSGWMLPVTGELSPSGRRLLCRALETEYRYYISILNSAENLSDQDVQASLESSRRSCPDLGI